MTTVDTLLFSDSLPTEHDGLGRVNEVVHCVGGKGMVTALALFHLGCKVETLSLVGESGESQSEVFSMLPKAFNLTYVKPWLLENNRTWIAMSRQQFMYTFVSPSPMKVLPKELLIAEIRTFVHDLSPIYITTEHVPVLREAINYATKAKSALVANVNLPLITDPADKDGSLLQSLIEASQTLLMNESESELALTKLGISNWSNLESQALRGCFKRV